MKVLFVYPGNSNIGLNAYYTMSTCADSWYMPIGLCYLASVVLKEGHEVDLLDLRYTSGFEQVEDKIVSSDSDIVAISFQTPGVKLAYEVAKIAKKYNKIVVAGGIHPSILPEETLNSSFFDHVVVGEGCISFPKVVNKLARGSYVAPLIIGEYVSNLDDIPFPHYFDLYVDSVIKEKKIVMMFTSRGCPGRCTYCQPVAHKLFGKKVRFRSADNIIAEVIEWKNKFDIVQFMLVDDTFMTKKKLVRDFCEKLIEQKIGLKWSCNARVNEFDEDTVRMMAESGCVWICIGFESGSQHILDITKKGTTVVQGYRAAELCYKYKIGFTTNILVGIPGETEEDYKLNLEFVKNIKATRISYNWLVPYPGTEIYEYCKSNKLLCESISWDNYEMNQIKVQGIINSINYDMARHWEGETEEIYALNIFYQKLFKNGHHIKEDSDIDSFFEHCLSLSKNDPEIAKLPYFLGKMHKKKGDLDKATGYLQQTLLLLKEMKKEDNGLLLSTHFHLGEIFYNLGKKDLARKEFEACTVLTTNHVKAKKYLKLLHPIQ
ncbi:MAG: radical SAM protein [bacterium]